MKMKPPIDAMEYESSRLLSWRNLLLLTAWVLAAFGTLQVHRLEDVLGHAICGPWGCGPPVSALVGYHGFWLLLLLPLGWLMKSRLTGARAQQLGTWLCVAAVAGIIALLVAEGWNNRAAHQYLLQWCFFRIATFVDFPLMQLGLLGLWLRSKGALATDERR